MERHLNFIAFGAKDVIGGQRLVMRGYIAFALASASVQGWFTEGEAVTKGALDAAKSAAKRVLREEQNADRKTADRHVNAGFAMAKDICENFASVIADRDRMTEAGLIASVMTEAERAGCRNGASLKRYLETGKADAKEEAEPTAAQVGAEAERKAQAKEESAESAAGLILARLASLESVPDIAPKPAPKAEPKPAEADPVAYIIGAAKRMDDAALQQIIAALQSEAERRVTDAAQRTGTDG